MTSSAHPTFAVTERYAVKNAINGEPLLRITHRHGMAVVNVVNESRTMNSEWFKFEGLDMNKKKIAKLGYVAAAGASFLFSISLWFTGSKQEGMFVGLWVPSILSFGTLVLGSSNHAK